VGSGTSVNWPTGLGGKGNEGVSGLIKQTPASIGYVELIYAKNNNLAFAHLMNKTKKTVEPNSKSVSAAAKGSLKDMPADFRVSITDADGNESYPISGFTYLLVYKNMDKAKGEKIVAFLKWAMVDGQKLTEPLHYTALPASLVTKVKNKIGEITLK
jgi:phosphate transport system substrate-binding protein